MRLWHKAALRHCSNLISFRRFIENAIDRPTAAQSSHRHLRGIAAVQKVHRALFREPCFPDLIL
jgi:hypothetical protein